MKKYYIIMTFLALLMLMGCNDSEFLDVDSQETVEADDSGEVYDPEMYINGVYGMFTDWDYAFSYLGITEIVSDNAYKGSSASDTGADKDLLDNLTYTSSASSIKAMWEQWYKSIGRATQSIEYTENYGLTDEDYKNRLIGEAKFLRALNYFFLVRGWGAVPIQSEDLEVRLPVSNVYAYIEQDLLDAIEYLPLKSNYDYADLGEGNKGCCTGTTFKSIFVCGRLAKFL